MHYIEITIKGKKLTDEQMKYVTKVVYEDSATGSDLVTIYIDDPDFKYMDSDIYTEEVPMSIKGGWLHDKSVTFSGFITTIDFDFPEEDNPSLTIHCMDNSHLMNRKANTITWKKKRPSDIAKTIFKKYGLKAVVDTIGKVEDSISQSDATDISFLIDLANNQIEDVLCYIEGKTGYFIKKKVLSSAQANLYYRSKDFSLKSFNPRMDKVSKQEEIATSNIKAKTKVTQKGKANENTKRDLQGKSVKTSSSQSSSSGYKYDGNGKWEKK
jgi:phage protein D